MLESMPGSRYGLTPGRPRSVRCRECCSKVWSPPPPVETTTATRRGSTSRPTTRPASASASSAAARASSTKRSTALVSVRGSTSSGSIQVRSGRLQPAPGRGPGRVAEAVVAAGQQRLEELRPGFRPSGAGRSRGPLGNDRAGQRGGAHRTVPALPGAARAAGPCGPCRSGRADGASSTAITRGRCGPSSSSARPSPPCCGRARGLGRRDQLQQTSVTTALAPAHRDRPRRPARRGTPTRTCSSDIAVCRRVAVAQVHRVHRASTWW